MRILLALALTLTLGALKPAEAQIQPGEKTPEMQITEWYNHEPMSLKALEGQVVAFTFVRLEIADCLYFLETWEELQNEFALKPVSLIAITNEPPEKVKESIEVEGIGVPVLIDPSDSGAKNFRVQIFPSVFVQDARGNLCYAGEPGTRQEIRDAIVEALRFAKPFPEVPKAARGVDRLLEKWQLSKAAAALDKELAKKKIDPDDKQKVQELRALITVLGMRLAKSAAAAIEKENWPLAVTALSRLIDEHEGLPESKGAAEKLAELKAREGLGDEIDAALLMAKGERFERESNWKNAVRTYEALAKQYPETKAGVAAAGQAAFLKPRAK
ncbi:MAG: redoxin domain-containing protein [Planctomycetota bacterium]